LQISEGDKSFHLLLAFASVGSYRCECNSNLITDFLFSDVKGYFEKNFVSLKRIKSFSLPSTMTINPTPASAFFKKGK
jgi:hypothetical protein